MMDGMMSGMMLAMKLTWLLVAVVLILSAATLVKYLAPETRETDDEQIPDRSAGDRCISVFRSGRAWRRRARSAGFPSLRAVPLA